MRPLPPRSRSQALLGLGLALLFACGGGEPGAATSPPRPGRAARKQKVQTLRGKLHTLQRKAGRQKAELRQTKRELRSLRDQLRQTYELLEAAYDRLRLSRRRLKAAGVAVQTATRRLYQAEVRLRRQQARLGRRIAVTYEEGPVSLTDVLLASENWTDLLDRQYYLSRVLEQDAELVRDLRQSRLLVAQRRERLVTEQKILARAHLENGYRVQEYVDQAAVHRELLRSIHQERALQEQRLAELEEDSNAIALALRRVLAQRLANPRGFRPLPRLSGGFGRPAHGRITSGFGRRRHPILGYSRLHTGIDIAAAPGAPVFAAATGEVLSAGWRGGYGRCIILLHGEGVATLYGHLSRIAVRPGQAVRRGQAIGAVGNTGLSTGPHLHFEVRRNGVPVNPR